LGHTDYAAAISLRDFVGDAIRADPVVREQLHIYRQAYQDHEIALSGWRPRLDLSASSGLVDQKEPAISDYSTSQIDLTLTQNLFNGFDTTNQIQQAKARIASAVYRLYDTADNAARDAIIAYINVLSERRLITLAEQNVNSHERILSQIIEQTAGGIGRKSDVEQTMGRLASAKAGLVGQQNNLQDALTQAHKLLGRYLHPNDFDEPSIPIQPDGELEDLISQALSNHPALESARRNIEAARFDYKRSKRTGFPLLDLQLQQSAGNNIGIETGRREDKSILLTMQYNLYRGGADAAEQKKKISEIHELEAFRKRVQRQVIDALRLAWTADQALKEQIPLLQEHVLKARQTLDLYHEEFLLNKRDLIDVLDAESELNTAQKRETEAIHDALIARFRVYEGLGRLFHPLELSVEVTDDDLLIADIRAQGIDVPVISIDSDDDKHSSDSDQCDNSASGSVVDTFGCEIRLEPKFGIYSTNTPPIANNDVFVTPANTALDISPTDILGNDSDADGDRLSMDSFTKPTTGSLIKDAEGYLVYSPARGFTGVDEFFYTVIDGRGGSATAKVTIRIEAAEPQHPETGNPANTDSPQTIKPPLPDNSTSSEPAEAGGLTAIEEIYFAYKKQTLAKDSQSLLDRLIPVLKLATTTAIEVRAHTDNVGSQEYNLPLSEQRARLVREVLIDNGVDGNKITAVGRGKLEPTADNSTEQGRAKNRRVEIRYTVENSASGNEQDVGHLQFGYKNTGLTEDSLNRLNAFAERLMRSPRSSVIIRAHTDNIGPEKYNQKLSEKRADDIKQLLITRGIPGHRVQAIGMGETTPIADNSTEEGRTQNRRAELLLRLELPE